MALLLSIEAGAQTKDMFLKVEVPGGYGYTFKAPLDLSLVEVEVTSESFSYVYDKDSTLASIPVCGVGVPNNHCYEFNKQVFLKAIAHPGEASTIRLHGMETTSIDDLWSLKGPVKRQEGLETTVRYLSELSLFIIEDEPHESRTELNLPLIGLILFAFLTMAFLKKESMFRLEWLFLTCFATSWGLLLVFLVSLQPTLELVTYTGTISFVWASLVTSADWVLFRNQDKKKKK